MSAGIGFGILLPEQQACHAFALELLMDGGEVRVSASRGRRKGLRRKQRLPQLSLAQIVWQWPGQLGGLSGIEIFVDDTNRKAQHSSNLPLRQSGVVFEP